MKYCKKCGKVLNENAKFCPECGEVIGSQTQTKIQPSKMDNCSNEQSVDDGGRKSYAPIIVVLVIVLAVLLGCGTYYFKRKELINSENVSIEKIDSSLFPKIKIIIKAEGINSDLVSSDFSIKENDAFQNGITLTKDGQERYIIQYTSTNINYNGNIKVSLQFKNQDKTIDLKSAYSGKYCENPSSNIANNNVINNPYNTTNNNSGNSLNESVDNSAVSSNNPESTVSSNSNSNLQNDDKSKVNQLMQQYEAISTTMINSRQYDYIASYVEENSPLAKSTPAVLKSYDKQKITETMLGNTIENINKIDDKKYEVTVYEKFDINYGVKNERKIMDFRAKYIVRDTGSGYKVYSVEDYKMLTSTKH